MARALAVKPFPSNDALTRLQTADCTAHIFTTLDILTLLYFSFLQIWVSTRSCSRCALDPLEKGLEQLNTALPVMELIGPLVINMISNVINRKFTQNSTFAQAKYYTRQKCDILKGWCWPISVEKGRFSAFSTALWLMEQIVRFVINIFCLNADLLMELIFRLIIIRSNGFRGKIFEVGEIFRSGWTCARGRGTAFWAPSSPKADAVAGRSEGGMEIKGVGWGEVVVGGWGVFLANRSRAPNS